MKPQFNGNPLYYRSLAASLEGRSAREAWWRWAAAMMVAGALIFLTGAVCVALFYAGAHR